MSTRELRFEISCGDPPSSPPPTGLCDSNSSAAQAGTAASPRRGGPPDGDDYQTGPRAGTGSRAGSAVSWTGDARFGRTAGAEAHLTDCALRPPLPPHTRPPGGPRAHHLSRRPLKQAQPQTQQLLQQQLKQQPPLDLPQPQQLQSHPPHCSQPSLGGNEACHSPARRCLP
eukprot:CAMPEP_0180043868 /NCGR_PEP_ID=MMETSP0984-20121128/35624_1 /TAXON_ID=483367 /ORGANISM="non described non described, Strain CCMP 2436" /LENGTH=170 /DNA_ID=CAMNT_0021972007 /DNA_START=192 /DNA_END=706 /DNA_ORIENTATION=-